MIIINQPAGLGDIMFTIPIARHFIAEGKTVIYPYDPVFGNIRPHWPDIRFIPKQFINVDPNLKEETTIDGVRIIPMRWSNKTGEVNPGTMKSKYELVGLPLDMWRQLTWIENKSRQNELAALLGIPDKYILLNQIWHHTARRVNLFINNPDKLPIVRMDIIPGFTLIDWCEIMRNATEFHTVGTSNIYLIELMKMKGQVHLYKRPNENNFDNYKYLLQKEYIYHG